MSRLQRFLPRTLLVRTFLLIGILLIICITTWLILFTLAEREPRARQLAQLTVSVANLTKAALVAADPVKRLSLLRDMAESEGVHLYPAEISDLVEALPDNFFFRSMYNSARRQLGSNARFAASVNGQSGIWVSFTIGDGEEDDYWLMLPSEHAQTDFPWHWLGWGGVSLLLAMLVAWLIVSRVTRPLRTLAEAAREVGKGRHPEPIAELGALELRQLARVFNRMSENLKRIEAERAEVLAGISHDLRTPLARLRLESELSISDEEARQAVVEDIEQMDGIIAQFLDYARGDFNEGKTVCDLNAMISQILESKSRNLIQKPEFNLNAPLMTAVHRQALSRAVVNLIENAIKYGGDEISVETCRKGEEILIDVMDRGPGIPENERERMKRPFTRLEKARTDASGTGLGLAIVDRIARLHEGSFELLAGEGGGLLARLRIPHRR